MDFFTKENLIAVLKTTATLMQENRDYLIELDSRIGDSDLGLTMTKGFASAYEKTAGLDDTDLGVLFKKAGFAILSDAPSTMGTLLATAYIGAGKAFTGKTKLEPADIPLMFCTMAESCKERGKADEGEKTMLDVLFPVCRAVSGSECSNIAGCFETAFNEAKIAVERTKDMVSQHGKAAVFREKTLGHIDPGAAATMIMIEGFYKGCAG